jgi:predicted nucleic acid-binding protein
VNLPGDGWIVDASFALSVVLDEAQGLEATSGRLLSSARPRRVVTTHFHLECANGLAQAFRRGRIELDDAFEALLLLMDLPFEQRQPAAAEVDALRLAYEHCISAYDAGYVALSDELGLPLVTADARLVQALAGTEHDVRLVDDMEP